MMNGSEAYFSFWENVSIHDDDNQTQQEFPQWRPVISLLLLGFWLLSVLLTTLLSSSVLLAVKKSSFNKILAILHIYVLVLNILVRVCSAVTLSSFIPPAIRFCDCSVVTSSISLYLHLFNICYQPYMFVNLAVFQLLIIKGKKRLVRRKTVGVTLTMIAAVTIVVPLIFMSVATKDGGALLCDSTIGCAGFDDTRFSVIFGSFFATVWVPSLSILVAVTVWSCAIFKKNYAGSDGDLNRRIVAMPLILPVIVTLISIATFASYRVVDFIALQSLSSKPFSRNWVATFKFIVVLLNEVSSGLSYPCLILFLNPKLWKSWKMIFMLKNCSCKKNQVTPEQSSNTKSSSQESSLI